MKARVRLMGKSRLGLTLLTGALTIASAACQTFEGEKKLPARVASGETQLVSKDSFLVEVTDNSKSSKEKVDDKADVYDLLQAGQWPEAEIKARNRLMTAPNDPKSFEILAAALLLQENYKLAYYYAEEGAKRFGDNANNLNIRGLAIYLSLKPETQNRRDEAETFLKRAMKASPKEIAAGINLGYLYMETGNVSAAKSAFTKTAKRCNQCEAAQVGLAIAESHLGHYKMARQLLIDISNKNPKNSRALFYLAGLYRYVDKNRDKAIDSLETLLANAPESATKIRAKAKKMLDQLKRSNKADS